MDPQHIVTELKDAGIAVRDDHDGLVLMRDDLLHLGIALLPKAHVAHAEHFIDQDDLCVQKCRDRERQLGMHAAGIRLHRLIDKIAQL